MDWAELQIASVLGECGLLVDCLWREENKHHSTNYADSGKIHPIIPLQVSFTCNYIAVIPPDHCRNMLHYIDSFID